MANDEEVSNFESGSLFAETRYRKICPKFAVGSLTLSIFLNSKVFEWSQELKLPSEIKLRLQQYPMLEQQRSPYRNR